MVILTATIADLRKFITNSDQYAKHPPNDWQDFFARIFSERNANYGEPQFIWLKVFEKATMLAEAIRKHNFDEATQAIARIFCWLCAFCTTNRDFLETGSLSEIIWQKYPGVCPYCANELKQSMEHMTPEQRTTAMKCIRCRCNPEEVGTITHKGIDEEVLAYFRDIMKMPDSLDDWVDMFDKAFGHNIAMTSLEAVSFHFLEEIGEVGTALRCYAELCSVNNNPGGFNRDDILQVMKNKKNDPRYISIKSEPLSDKVFLTGCLKCLRKCATEEVADVFSWLSAVVIKLTKIRTSYIEYDKRYLRSTSSDVRRKTSYGNALVTLMEEFVPRSRKLSSMVAITYTNGCTTCNNLAENQSVICTCRGNLPPRVYG